MTGFRTALLLTALWRAGSGVASAGEAAAVPPAPGWIITAECRMIVVSESRMLALLPELLDEARIEAAGQKLEALIAKGEARLAASLLVRTDTISRNDPDA